MRRGFFLVGAVFAVALLALYCRQPRTILIGFSGQLTGTMSDLGVQGRNGATLAVEDVNASKILGSDRLKLLAVDDANTPEGALKADQLLLDSGVVAIVGHMTSSQTLAAMPLAESRGAVFVSPTTATPELTGKKDGFFRVIPENTSWARSLASYATADLGLKRVFLLGDTDNAPYVDAFNAAFLESFTRAGGSLAGSAGFSSRSTPDWERLVRMVDASGAQAVVLAASARDVAAFAKARTLVGSLTPVLCPTWPYTREILLAGGASVEGVIFSSSYTEENTSPEFARFCKRYEERFGWPPNFAAAYAYEAVQLLARALRATGGFRQGLEAALAEAGELQGVIGRFSLDQYGDVVRDNFIVTIRDGRFRTVRNASDRQ
jgi:branched-chain amino acid transport system substrate-binding protein